PDVVELDRLHRAGGVEVGALLVRADAFVDREQQGRAPGGDERVSARREHSASGLGRGLEHQDTSLAADVPLEIALDRSLRGQVRRAESERQGRDGYAAGDHPHHTSSLGRNDRLRATGKLREFRWSAIRIGLVTRPECTRQVVAVYTLARLTADRRRGPATKLAPPG